VARPTRAGRARPEAARCRTGSNWRFGSSPTGRSARCAPVAPTPACTRSTRWCTSIRKSCVRRSRGCEEATASCPTTSPCNGVCRWPTRSTPGTLRVAGVTATWCSRRRCARRSSRAWPVGSGAPSTAMRCRVPRQGCSASTTSVRSGRPNARRRRRSRRCAASTSRAAGPTGASSSTPTRSCTTWCATSWVACWPPEWVSDVLAARDRHAAAPTFAAAGLYFIGPYYDAHWAIPVHVPASDWPA
jgi:hypothetical protein